jgi:decaprenylphospho-beta-D-ribofuranose 2-oxidase
MTKHATANTRRELETSRRERLAGWALIHSANAQVYAPRSVNDLASVIDTAKSSGLTITPRGAGHSYTDAALNRDQIVVDLRDFRRVLSWDPAQGVMDVEPGVTVGEVCELAIASGWWPAVVPGTQCPTIGGCAALNVHGKNHWRKGSFGEHIEEFDIATSSGEVLTVSPSANPALFHAAIGGAGMLGIFTRLRLRLMPVGAGSCTVRTVSVASLRDMFTIFDSSADHADYMFGWIDGFASGRALGRGAVWTAQLSAGSPPRRNQGVMAALSSHLHVWDHAHLAMNDACVRRANSAVWTLSKIGGGRTRDASLTGFNFRLDATPGWQRAWYPLGSREFQAFMPEAEAPEVFAELLRRSQLSGVEPYLCSVKRHRSDAFLLSYVRSGYSLSLDYRVTTGNAGRLDKLLRELRDVVLAAKGRLYFAKDDILDAPSYAQQTGSSTVRAFLVLRKEHDPASLFMSDLYRRVFAGQPGATPW